MHAIFESPAKLIERREQLSKTMEYLREERCGLEQMLGGWIQLLIGGESVLSKSGGLV